MSVQATTWVWDHLQVSKSNELLVALAIADAADKYGENSCQSVDTVAAMARVNRATVHRCLAELKASGQIIATGTSGYGTVTYALPGVRLGGPVPDPRVSQIATARVSQIATVADCDLSQNAPRVSQNEAEGVAKQARGCRTAATQPHYPINPTNPIRRDTADAAPPKRARGSRIPDDFTVTDDMRQWADSKGIRFDIDAVTENFVDYWRAQSGARATKVDWVATWRTWMRNEQTRATRGRYGRRVPDATVQRRLGLRNIAEGGGAP